MPKRQNEDGGAGSKSHLLRAPQVRSLPVHHYGHLVHRRLDSLTSSLRQAALRERRDYNSALCGGAIVVGFQVKLNSSESEPRMIRRIRDLIVCHCEREAESTGFVIRLDSDQARKKKRRRYRIYKNTFSRENSLVSHSHDTWLYNSIRGKDGLYKVVRTNRWRSK